MIAMRGRAVVVLLAVATMLAACGSRSDAYAAAKGPIVVREAWARPADSGATGGLYLTIANVDTGAVTITALSTPMAASAEMHETMQMDGMVHMSARPNVIIERGGTLTMVPGGLHVMLSSLTRSLRVGDSVPLTVSVGDGRTAPIMVPVTVSVMVPVTANVKATVRAP